MTTPVKYICLIRSGYWHFVFSSSDIFPIPAFIICTYCRRFFEAFLIELMFGKKSPHIPSPLLSTEKQGWLPSSCLKPFDAGHQPIASPQNQTKRFSCPSAAYPSQPLSKPYQTRVSISSNVNSTSLDGLKATTSPLSDTSQFQNQDFTLEKEIQPTQLTMDNEQHETSTAKTRKLLKRLPSREEYTEVCLSDVDMT